MIQAAFKKWWARCSWSQMPVSHIDYCHALRAAHKAGYHAAMRDLAKAIKE